MNLVTGVLRLAITEPFRPRLDRIDDEVRLRFRVSPLDLDYNRHMNNARYFTAMELARLALMSRTGMLRLALGRRLGFANAAQKAVFFRPLRLFDRYTVSCALLYVDDEWLFLKQHVRHAGELAAIGLFKLRIKRGRDTVSPRTLAAELGHPGFDGPPPEVVEWERVNGLLVDEKRSDGGAGR